MKLTPHEEKILELVQQYPEIVNNSEARKKIAEEQGLSEKTLRNRIADLKKYGAVGLEKNMNAISTSDDQTLREIFLIIWNSKWKIFRNVFVFSILSVLLALVMPLTYRSNAVIMPPSSESGLNISAALSSLPFGNMLGGGTDTQSMTFVAILESRLIKEAVINEFNLIEFYNVDFHEDALEELGANTSIEIEEEGTIKIAFMASTSWFHPNDEGEYCKNLTRDVTNYYVNKLDEVNKQLNSEKAVNHRKFIEERYNLNKIKLMEAENELNSFQKSYNAIALEQQTGAVINIAATIKGLALANEVKLEILTQTLPENHPDLINLQKETDILNNQLTNLNTGSEIDYFLPKFAQVPDLGLEYIRLTRMVEVQNQIFIFLTQQYEEAKIKEAKDTPTLQVLDHASKPEKKYKPSRTRICIIGFVLSFIFSLYYYYLSHRWNEISK